MEVLGKDQSKAVSSEENQSSNESKRRERYAEARLRAEIVPCCFPNTMPGAQYAHTTRLLNG